MMFHALHCMLLPQTECVQNAYFNLHGSVGVINNMLCLVSLRTQFYTVISQLRRTKSDIFKEVKPAVFSFP